MPHLRPLDSWFHLRIRNSAVFLFAACRTPVTNVALTRSDRASSVTYEFTENLRRY